MSLLLWRASLRFLMRHPLQMCLSVLGVTLGVATVVAIDLANQSAKRAFSISADAIAGKATHRIIGGPRGLPDDTYRHLRMELGVRQSTPVVEGYATLPNGSVLRLLGIDPFTEAPFRSYADGGNTAGYGSALLITPGAALASADTAQLLGVQAGDTLQARIAGFQRTLHIVGVISPQDRFTREALKDLLITDISTAQELAGFEGYLSHIDLIIPDDAAGETLAGRIRSALPEDATLIPVSSGAAAIRQLTGSFDDDIFMLSLLAMVVGTFLIYNTMTFSVVQRRPVIGTLRAVGVTRRQVFVLVLSEALLIGIVGAIAGIVLGILLGRGLTGIVAQTISDLFYAVSVRELSIPAWSLAKGALLGIGATLTATIAPAFEASGVPARAGLSRSRLETRIRSGAPIIAVVGIAVSAVGAGLMLIPAETLTPTFVGLLTLIVGYALLTPVILIVYARAAAPMMRRVFGITGHMAARGISASLSRTAVAIAALAVAVSITIAIDTMVSSFRATLQDWLGVSLASDIYITAQTSLSHRIDAGLAPALLERIRSVDGIAAVRTVRTARVQAPDGETQVLAIDAPLEDFNRPRRFKAGNPAEIWDAFQSGDAVVVSEPYAYHNSVDVGDTLRLYTALGEQDFRIAGIYYDYGNSGRGVVLFSRKAYDRFWDDERFTSVGVDALDGVSIPQLANTIRQAIGGAQEVEVRSNAEIRAAALEVFERSFAITSIMRLLAILVAAVGILSTLMAIQLERAREFGVLRTLGFTPKQIWALITAQTGLMGLAAGLLGVPLGIAEAAALIFIVNRRSFGWTMPMELDPLILVQAVALAIGAALVASAYPAFKMWRSPPVADLREE